MKGVVLKDKRNLGVEDLDDPISQNGSVILSVKRAGICGSDIHYWEDGRPKGDVYKRQGAAPGKIIRQMKKARTNNSVFLID